MPTSSAAVGHSWLYLQWGGAQILGSIILLHSKRATSLDGSHASVTGQENERLDDSELCDDCHQLQMSLPSMCAPLIWRRTDAIGICEYHVCDAPILPRTSSCSQLVASAGTHAPLLDKLPIFVRDQR